MSRALSQPSSAAAADHSVLSSSPRSRSRKLPEFRMKVGAIKTTVVMLIVTFSLASMSGSHLLLPLVVAGAFLFFVLLMENGSWIVHALLIVAFTTTPELPLESDGLRIFGKLIYYYEFLVFGSLIYAIWLLHASPFAARRLRNSVAVWAALSFGITVAIGITLGILRGYPLYDIQFDVRTVVIMLIVLLVAAVIVAVNDWQRYMKTIVAILYFSAALTIYASFTGMSLGGRTEAAQLYGGQGRAIAGDSHAIRYLTSTSPLALAVLLGCLALLMLGRITAKRAVLMLIPSLLICFFSFSRNTILALAGAVVFVLLIALLNGHLVRLALRLGWISLVAGVALFGLLSLGTAMGAGDWIDTQATGYGVVCWQGPTSRTKEWTARRGPACRRTRISRNRAPTIPCSAAASGHATEPRRASVAGLSLRSGANCMRIIRTVGSM